MEVIDMIGIYKIENKINHHVYIGQSINIKQRWIQHKVPSSWNDPIRDSYNNKLYGAFRKYGLDNFDFSIIEECAIEKLNEREIYWIKYYNSCENGYNLTIGGQNNKESDKAVYQYDRYGNFIKAYKNVRSAAEELAIDTNNIYDAICGGYLGRGYQWSYQKVDHMPFYINNELPVIAYDLNGNKVENYNSINEAERLTGDGRIAIATACETRQYNNKTKYQWRYAQDYYKVNKIENSFMNNPKAITQYDLNGKFIANYNSIDEAINNLNLKDKLSRSNLTTCLNKRQKSYAGFLWTYYNEPAPAPYVDKRIGHITSSHKRIIQQFDKNNNYITDYESACEAARQIGKPKCANHITECCQGKRKTCEGFIWKYKEE